MTSFLAFKRGTTIGTTPTSYSGIMTSCDKFCLEPWKNNPLFRLTKYHEQTIITIYKSDYINRFRFWILPFLKLKMLNLHQLIDKDYCGDFKYGKKIYQILDDIIMNKWHSNQINYYVIIELPHQTIIAMNVIWYVSCSP